MRLKDRNIFDVDLLDGKHAANSANNIPVLDGNAKLPIAQIPTGTSSSTVSLGNHNHTYDVNNAWLRESGDNANFKIFGNTRQVAFRTDGTTEYASGVGGYPFTFMYGGDAAANRLMLLSTGGDIWFKQKGNWLSTLLDGKSDTSHTHSYLPLSGGTLTGTLVTKTPSLSTSITNTTSNAVIKTNTVNAGSTAGTYFLPLTEQACQHGQGYVTHVTTGLIKNGYGSGWGEGVSGFFVGVGGSDSNPTEYFTLAYGGKIKHSKGHEFYSTAFKPTPADIGAAASSHNHTSLTGVTKLSGAGASSSWGSLDIGGTKGSWAGVHFSDYGYVWMVRNDGYTGMWKNGGSPVFAFDQNGALATGSIPWSKLTSVPGSFTPSSHTHGHLEVNNTETKNVGRLQMIQVSGNGSLMPDTGWWSLLRMQHGGYTNGYWQEMAMSFASDNIRFRRNVNGSFGSWRTLWHSGNFNPDNVLQNGTTVNAAYGSNTRSIRANGINNDSISLRSHNECCWFRNQVGRWVFQANNDGDDWTKTFEIYASGKDSASANNNGWIDFGQMKSNQTNGIYRGVSIRKYEGGTVTAGDITAARYYLNGAQCMYGAANECFGFSNKYGEVTIGPRNSGCTHYETDRPFHYFNKEVQVDGNIRNYGNNKSMISQTFRIPGTAGGENANYFCAGNADNATYDQHNLILRTWWGLGIRDYQDICRIVFDARLGNIYGKGYFECDTIRTTNNGSGTNVRLGDDCWIGDCNEANTFKVRGNQDSNQGKIRFGGGGWFGYDGGGSGLVGSGHMYLHNNISVHNIEIRGTGYVGDFNLARIKPNGTRYIDLCAANSSNGVFFSNASSNQNHDWFLVGNGNSNSGAQAVLKPRGDLVSFVGGEGNRFYRMYCGGYNTSSYREGKTLISRFNRYDVLDDIKAMQVYTYKQKTFDNISNRMISETTGSSQLGIMLNDAPIEIIDQEGTKSIDLYSYSSFILKGLQSEIEEREFKIEELESKIGELESKIDLIMGLLEG